MDIIDIQQYVRSTLDDYASRFDMMKREITMEEGEQVKDFFDSAKYYDAFASSTLNQLAETTKAFEEIQTEKDKLEHSIQEALKNIDSLYDNLCHAVDCLQYYMEDDKDWDGEEEDFYWDGEESVPTVDQVKMISLQELQERLGLNLEFATDAIENETLDTQTLMDIIHHVLFDIMP